MAQAQLSKSQRMLADIDQIESMPATGRIQLLGCDLVRKISNRSCLVRWKYQERRALLFLECPPWVKFYLEKKWERSMNLEG